METDRKEKENATKRKNVTYRGYKIYKTKRWQIGKKEQLHPIGDKDKNNLNIKMQWDDDTYI